MTFDLPLAIAALGIGIVVGLTGMGGGALMTPVLVLFFDVLPLTAVSSDLVASAVMKPVGSVVHLRRGTVHLGLVKWLCAGSVPAAYAGGLIQLPTRSHRILLGAVLLFAAVRLAMKARSAELRPPPSFPWLVAIGLLFGFVAGLTGVGGGIFLSPLLILARWEEPRRTAGASAVFILVNSAAGLAGHLAGGGSVPSAAAPLTAIALVGGLFGSWLGARRLVPLTLRRLLAVVLVIAGAKLLL